MRTLSVALRLLCATVICVVCPRVPAQSARSLSEKSFSGNWDESKAAEIALQISRSWQAPLDHPRDSAGKPLQRNVYAFLPFDKSGVTRWLVLVAQSPADFTCHACAPVTGGVIFTRKDKKKDDKDSVFDADHDQANITNLGAFGKPPQAHVQQLGDNRPAIAFEMNSMAQGYQATTLILITEVEGKLTKVLSLQTFASNEAAALPDDQTFKWQAALEFVPGSNPEYSDIRVKSTGTREIADGPDAGKVRPHSSTALYRFSDGTYKLALK
jgi:hypothetical protein